MTITVSSGIAGRTVVQIDDRTTDEMPATYDQATRRYNEDVGDYL